MLVKKKNGKAADEGVANPNSKVTTEELPDDTAKKVSRLATATSVSAFVATACLVFSFVTHAQAAAAVAEVQSDLVAVVVAAKDIPKGTVVKDDMVQLAEVPSKYLSSDAMTSIEDAVGKQSNVKIGANSQLRSGELSGSGNTSSLAGKISKGKKAVSIDVNTESGFACSLLHQGDRVSIYCFDEDKSGTREKRQLAKDVEVIALDSSLSYSELANGGSSVSYSNVTVEVDQQTAVEIRDMQDDGKAIWMVLTSETDTKR